MARLEGVVGALPSPFGPDGDIDRDQLTALHDFLASHCDGVSVLGAEVSEYSALPAQLRRELLVEGVGQLRERTTVLAGVSASRVADVLELAELAAQAGAHYAQVLIPARPSGGSPTTAEVVAFVEAVVSRSPLPVVLYHHPGAGADPNLETLVELCAVDNVVAVKDSSRDISRNLRAVEEIQHAGHAQYLATIQPMLAVLLSGGAGAMTPAGLTLVAAEIRDAVRDGDLARAGRAQRLVGRFPAAWSKYGLLPLAKVALEILGVPAGGPPAPYPPLPDSVRDEIRPIIEQWQH